MRTLPVCASVIGDFLSSKTLCVGEKKRGRVCEDQAYMSQLEKKNIKRKNRV